jgi:hypothetical protein
VEYTLTNCPIFQDHLREPSLLTPSRRLKVKNNGLEMVKKTGLRSLPNDGLGFAVARKRIGIAA